MVNIIKRARRLQDLLWIRCGPGALILPKEVSKIGMEFNTKIYGGHHGARKFWREMLPRIKYRNPSIPIEIARHTTPDGPSLLHIYTTSSTTTPTPTPTSPPPSDPAVPDTSKPTHTIDIRNKPESEILDALLKVTRATVLQPSEAEVLAMREIQEWKERGEKDRAEVRGKLEAERREAELLRVARGEVPA